MISLSRLLLFSAVLSGLLAPVHAQLSVNMSIKRKNFIRHEPVLATVSVTNLSGRDLQLHDGESPWFGFQVTVGDSTNLIPPRNQEYRLDPLEIKMGETVKRTVNLNTLYSLSEYGLHKVHARIYMADGDKYFRSPASLIEITEGSSLWEATVGVPEGLKNGGSQHTYSLLEHQTDKRRQLYVRVEDRESGIVFCTYQLGHMIDGHKPTMQLDTSNNLYVLHLIGPKTHLLNKIGINGEFLDQQTYLSTKSRPYLRRLQDGTLQIVGGRRETSQNMAAGTAATMPAPKLSDRPVTLPGN